MSNFWLSLTKFLANNIESISVKNTESGPQVLINPTGTVKELIEVVQKGMSDGKATKEDEQATSEENRKATT